MIIVKIFGGLGNQLFQYAAAKALAVKHSTDLKADITDLESSKLRDFELNKLSITIPVASKEEIKKYKAYNSLQRILAKITSYQKRKFYKEPFYHFDNRYFNLGNNVYLQGYFQSEKYFTGIKDSLRQHVIVKTRISDEVKEFALDLQRQPSVAIHVRRGDYNHKEALEFHGILPVSYYYDAIGFIKRHQPATKFYLFTDTVKQEGYKELGNITYEIVSGKISQNHFEDLFLMSHCHHNIIANSSFSWWGAWLNQNPDKIVIAPKNWFNNGPKDTQDLYPSDWIKL